MNFEGKTEKWITPVICLTHRCNLSCVYCYEKNKDIHHNLQYEVATKIINDIISDVKDSNVGIEFGLIGGEPLLEFDLIKRIVEYVRSIENTFNNSYVFSATTNGTVLNKDMKDWFVEHKDKFILCLSLDGLKDTHDYNRSNSFDKIDFNFFLKNYPNQGVKMTLSDFSIDKFYENIIFIHELGFKKITGVNLFEGDFDFSSEEYLKILAPQLKKLVDFYSRRENQQYYNQLFDKPLELAESKDRRMMKNCGIGGVGSAFYDTDGKRYPCVMCTEMTLSFSELKMALKTDFNKDSIFVDYSCNEDCYIYPICSNCPGSNFVVRKDFSKRDKSRCSIKELEMLFVAELRARKLVNKYITYKDEIVLYSVITAIEKIRNLYYDKYKKYIQEDY